MQGTYPEVTAPTFPPPSMGQVGANEYAPPSRVRPAAVAVGGAPYGSPPGRAAP